MKMRNATVDDIEAIVSLIEQNNIQRSESYKATNGLIEYKANPSLIKKAIQSKEGYISVLEGSAEEAKEEAKEKGKEKGEIIGAIIGYHKNFLSNIEFKEDKIVQYLLNNIMYDFVYADILVVEKSEQGKQFGRMLMMSFLDDTKNKTIIGAVSLTPYKNEASLKLLGGFRFTKEAEITVYNGLTFGIFELDN